MQISVKSEYYQSNYITWGHSITTWTGGGGEGVSQMSMIVHAREGGGLVNVHVDKILG